MIRPGDDRPVPLVDVAQAYERIRDAARARFDQVASAGALTLGAELAAFEEEFATYCGARHCVGLSDGTSALRLALLALGVGPGTEVITVPSTFFATVEAIVATGARPVLADIDPVTRCLSPEALEASITSRTVAAVVVHLYGRPAPLHELQLVCRDAGIALVEDAAQAHGARLGGRRAGTWGAAGAFSFYPTKNLGALGDGGAVVTDDETIAATVRSLRHHGSAPDDPNVHLRFGATDRMDNLQAAFLRLKLPELDASNARRRLVAERYREELSTTDIVLPAPDPDGGEQVYHLFAVEVADRDRVLGELRQQGIGAAVHYPTPVHLQPAWREPGRWAGAFPASEALSRRTLSLPIFPEITDAQVDRVADAVRRAVARAPRDGRRRTARPAR